MMIRYATKRNPYGNRNIIVVDHENKVYTRQPAHWFCREDFIEITKTDMNKLENILDNNGYTETDKPL